MSRFSAWMVSWPLVIAPVLNAVLIAMPGDRLPDRLAIVFGGAGGLPSEFLDRWTYPLWLAAPCAIAWWSLRPPGKAAPADPDRKVPSRWMFFIPWALAGGSVAATALIVAANLDAGDSSPARLPGWAFAGPLTWHVAGLACGALAALLAPHLLSRSRR